MFAPAGGAVTKLPAGGGACLLEKGNVQTPVFLQERNGSENVRKLWNDGERGSSKTMIFWAKIVQTKGERTYTIISACCGKTTDMKT